MKHIIAALTGASGSPYFMELMKVLSNMEIKVHVIASENGKKVFAYETGRCLKEQMKIWQSQNRNIIWEDNDNLFSCTASGSYPVEGMIILPCSMATMAEINAGISKTLLTRAADVCIKEGRRLVIVPRETPLSTLHLRNMYELSKLGAIIVPAMPAFYHIPESVEDMISFVVGRALKSMEIDNACYKEWKGLENESKKED